MPVQFYLLFFAAVLSQASEATPENLSIAFDGVSNPNSAVKRPGQRQATHPKLLQVHTLPYVYREPRLPGSLSS